MPVSYCSTCRRHTIRETPTRIQPHRTASVRSAARTFSALSQKLRLGHSKPSGTKKWFVHRRLRPEAFGGLVHHVKVNGAPYQLDLEILNDAPGTVLARIHNQNVAKGHNSFLLPQAFPEGSPLHPA